MAAFAPAFQVRAGDTPRAFLATPPAPCWSLCVQCVGGKVDLLFQHTRGHARAAMCLAGERHRPRPSAWRCWSLPCWDLGWTEQENCAWWVPSVPSSTAGLCCPPGSSLHVPSRSCPATYVLPRFESRLQQGLPPSFPCLSQVVAGFSFAARSPQEVSLQAGQPVVVLEPHDKKGSKEWSLVDVNGQRGYVPSSYLVTVPAQEPAGWSLPV